MPATLLKNARVVSGTEIRQADVLVEDGKIKQVESGISESSGEVIDCSKFYLIPGGLDPQVHFREPGQTWKEDLESGSRAAAAGGITGFFDMPNNKPSVVTAEAMSAKKAIAAEKCRVNYNFFIGATNDNVEELNATENVCGIKIFMGASTGDLLVSERKYLENIFANGSRLIAVHAEDDEMINEMAERYKHSEDFGDHRFTRPAEAALKASKLAIELSVKNQRRLHILHLTTADEVQYLREHKSSGPISTELCPQHFLLKAPDVYERLGSLAQMNPPLRDAEHGIELWDGLKDGTIDCIATDHAPHTLEEKAVPFGSAPSGMPGVETSMPLLLHQANQGNCSIKDVVRWMCENPVKLYGVKNKGYVRDGFDADLVLIDMEKRKTIRDGELFTRVNWSPYNGWTTQGWPHLTMVGGQVVFREGEIDESVRGNEIQIDDQINSAAPRL